MKEIGSEFSFEMHNLAQVKKNFFLNGGFMVFSGRTAIETILRNEPSIHSALLPSYCCDSMIEPFRKAGIKVNFFSVNYDNGLKIEVDELSSADCLLWCNYFGFHFSMPDLSALISRGGIIIEDITHSFLSNEQYHKQSHYLVASLRKWEAILCGGYCVSHKNALKILPEKNPPDLFLEQKKRAMKLKKSYLSGDSSIKKDDFLHMFIENNKWLSNNYSNLTIDEYSKQFLLNTDYLVHREIRINNALKLYEGLKNHCDIKFMYPIELMDCPLFVPVIIQSGKRDMFRKKLIENNIYCPIHWPKPNADCVSNLYDIELSLICDQRYTEKDMQRIIDVLNS